MGVSSTILYGNCIEKNQPVSGTGHHKVVIKGKNHHLLWMRIS